MKRVISLLVLLILLASSEGIVSAKSISKNDVLRGEALLEVPEYGIESLDSITREDALLSVKNFTINDLTLHLDGELSYQDKTFSIKKDGRIKSSVHNEEDLNIDFNESRSSNEDISLVNALVRYDISDKDLLVSKSLNRDAVIQLVFLNNKTNDLIIIEDKVSEINGQALKKLEKDKLEKAKFDVWGHKVFKAAKVEERDVTHLYKEQEGRHIGLSSTPVSNYVYRQLMASYRIVGGWETHITTVRASITGSSGWSGTNPFFTELRVTSMSYTDTRGRHHSGASVVQAGHYSNPVRWSGEVQKGSSANRDILQRIRWDKNAYAKSSGRLTLSFSIGWGPLSYSYTPNSFSQSVKEASSTQIWSGGSQYPGDASVRFSNTYLHRTGQFYNGELWVTHSGSKTTKRANSVYTIPYYNSDSWEYLGSATLSTGVNYISR